MPSRSNSEKPVKILHITDQLSKGGAGRALIGVAKYSQRLGNFHHECISVKPPFDGIISENIVEGLKVHEAPSLDEIKSLIDKFDIVQWHWWQDFPLMREELPGKPRIVWCAVSGEYPPNELTREVVDFADKMVITNPMTRDLHAIQSLPESERQRKVKLIFESADFERILPVQCIPHDTFNVGWIGTICQGKYNPRYVEMSSKISLPNVKFMVLGEGPLKEQAMRDAYRLGVLERFNFAGYHDDMRQVLGLFDVYGFPLDEKTFAGGELNLQEVMVAGLPIVVFPYGGPKRMILHDYNGLIAYSEKEYKEYIEYLYYHPEERKRLGNNAKEYALREFGAENAARKYNRLYKEMLAERQQSVAIPETETDHRKRLAIYHQGKGQLEKAAKYAEEYLRDHFDDEEIIKLLERVTHAKSQQNQPQPSLENSAEIERFIDTRLYSEYRVSAIVSTYNSEDVIKGCLEDLMQQTLYKRGELEIIVVDSASPQNEWSIIEEISADNQHILALRTRQRETLYTAWNRAIKLATSPYITNANADDRHRPDGLELLADALDRNTEAAVAYGDSWKTTRPNEKWGRHSAQDVLQWGDYFLDKLEHHCCVGPHPMWRKSLHDEIGWFDTRYQSAADYDFWLRVALKYPLIHLDEIVGLFYHNPESLGNAGQKVHEERIEVQRRYHARKLNQSELYHIEENLLDSCSSPGDVINLTLEKNFRQIFPDLYDESHDDPRSDAVACMRIALRFMQLNDIENARNYLEKSYSIVPTRETRQLLEILSASRTERNQADIPNVVSSDSAKRILLVVHGFPPEKMAGTELHTFWLAQELRSRNWDVHVLYPEEKPERTPLSVENDLFEGIHVAKVAMNQALGDVGGFYNEGMAYAISKYAKTLQPDVVHFQHLMGVSATAVEAVKHAGIPTVMTVHDGWLLCDEHHFVSPGGHFCSGPESVGKCVDCLIQRHVETDLNPLRKKLNDLFDFRRKYLVNVPQWLDAMIVPSQYTKDRLTAFNLAHSRTRVIPHGIPLFEPVPHKPRKEKIRFTFMGQIFFTKGVDLLVEAFNQLPPDKAELHLYGGKPDPDYFDQVMAAVKPGCEVTYHGKYAPADLAEILSQTDLAVLASRSESFSYIVREAFLAKVPVIGPEVGGVPEAIDDGVNGFLFPVGDAAGLASKMRYFIDHPNDIKRFSDNIGPVSTISDYVSEVESLYREIAEKRPVIQPPQYSETNVETTA